MPVTPNTWMKDKYKIYKWKGKVKKEDLERESGRKGAVRWMKIEGSIKFHLRPFS